MRKKLVGKMNFGGIVQITDPCYDNDVWCRTTIDVIPGDYSCYVWHNTDKYESDGKMVSDTRVGVIGIYLEGAIPPQKSMEEVATIGVDAGLAGFFMKKPDYDDSQWDEFCNLVCGTKKDEWIIKDKLETEGFFSSSGYGDGVYPVYVAKTPGGGIYAAEIRFI